MNTIIQFCINIIGKLKRNSINWSIHDIFVTKIASWVRIGQKRIEITKSSDWHWLDIDPTFFVLDRFVINVDTISFATWEEAPIIQFLGDISFTMHQDLSFII